ncbi:MAG: phytanoyl-CoA dioxygenase family protein [Chthonomonadaceae bacterium]|nr:phytanoyl-CoA dioxygenase family protein [Chthonomonadaceae bacterium]
MSDPLKGTALWTAIHDATLKNGTLEVIPGSFTEALPHSRDPEINHHIRRYPDESKAVPVQIPVGGVIFFAYGTAHCTRANRTEKDRAGAAFHFLNADSVPADYFESHNQGAVHPMLAGEKTDGGMSFHNEDMRGVWQIEVKKLVN